MAVTSGFFTSGDFFDPVAPGLSMSVQDVVLSTIGMTMLGIQVLLMVYLAFRMKKETPVSS